MKKTDNFNSLIDSLKDDTYDFSIFEKIKTIITMGGRIPFDDGINQLTEFQKYIINSLDDNNIEYHTTPVKKSRFISLKYGAKVFSRLLLEEYIEDDTNVNDMIWGYILVPDKIYNKAKSKHQSTEDKNQLYIRKQLRQIEDMELKSIVDRILYIHIHMAPVIYYVYDVTYTNFYNAGKKNSKLEFDILETLEHLDNIEHYTNHEAELVYCCYLLDKSGPATRFEEFNGQQLTFVTVNVFFESKIAYYKQFIKLSDHNNNIENNISLECKAKWINETRKILTNRLFFYRSVNGLNLHKKELISTNTDHYLNNTLPLDIQHYFKKTFSIPIQKTNELYDVFSLIFQKNLNLTTLYNFSNIAEELIHIILQSALQNLNSDIVMSRSLKNIGNLINIERNEDLKTACDWPQTNYFCYVLPTKRIIESFTDKDSLLRVLNAISARMRYNSWHYLPGNYNDKSGIRNDYYFPPVMSDIAAHSDRHHPGHVHSSVMHSIRSPQSINICGREYKAFFDLRLMKTSGEPYDLTELSRAVSYTSYLQHLYQALSDHIYNTDEFHEFSFATKEWNKKHYKDMYINTHDKKIMC